MTPSMDFRPPDVDLREKDLQKQVRGMLAQFGWRVAVTWTSLHSPKGWPDLFAVRCEDCHDPGCLRVVVGTHRSEAVAIELKREKGKVSPEQEEWLALLRQLPGVKFADVIRPSDWYAGVLDEVLR